MSDPVRVLVVDDEEMVALSLRRLLKPHHVTTCLEGREAVERFCGDDYDLMFCDLMMPGFGGIEVYEAVRARRPGLESRIVFMSGGVFSPHAQAFLDRTYCPTVEKPFDRPTLLEVVREATSR